MDRQVRGVAGPERERAAASGRLRPGSGVAGRIRHENPIFLVGFLQFVAGHAAVRAVVAAVQNPLNPAASTVRRDSAVREAPPAARSGAPSAAASGEYEQQIARWVDRHRDHPPAARRRGLEGTAVVRLRLGADGSVLHAQIVRDTGHALLDRAVLGMIERAAPFPGVPPELRGAPVEVLDPIQFAVGR
jgi:TonB family protein